MFTNTNVVESIRFSDASIRGVKTRIYSSGHESKTAVVFLHGNPGPADDWFPVMREVSDFAYAIAPDMPGFGYSDRSANFTVSIESYAEHLHAILNHLQIEKVHLVLHDFGGAWGLAWAANYPDRVLSICLVNAGIDPEFKWHKYARIWRTPLLGELFQLTTTRIAFKTLLNADNPKPFPDEFIDRIMFHADWGHKKTVLKLYRATDETTVQKNSQQIIETLYPKKIQGLILWGDSDVYLPVRQAEVQRKFLHAEVVYMKNCGHWPMVDDPDQFNKLIMPYLRLLYE